MKKLSLLLLLAFAAGSVTPARAMEESTYNTDAALDEIFDLHAIHVKRKSLNKNDANALLDDLFDMHAAIFFGDPDNVTMARIQEAFDAAVAAFTPTPATVASVVDPALWVAQWITAEAGEIESGSVTLGQLEPLEGGLHPGWEPKELDLSDGSVFRQLVNAEIDREKPVDQGGEAGAQDHESGEKGQILQHLLEYTLNQAVEQGIIGGEGGAGD